MKVDLAKAFAESFKQGSGGIHASAYSASIRFIAILLVIIALMWCINYFMNYTEKAQEGFLIEFGSRLIRIVIGLCLFILILIV